MKSQLRNCLNDLMSQKRESSVAKALNNDTNERIFADAEKTLFDPLQRKIIQSVDTSIAGKSITDG